MAKFFYRMQNILDIKYKLEESAKQEYADARQRLTEEEEKLQHLHGRRAGYVEDYNQSINGRLDFIKIEENANISAVFLLFCPLRQSHKAERYFS